MLALRRRNLVTELKRNQGNIPVLYITGENLPEAWEKAVLAVWHHGVDIKTEYDLPETPPSKDATVMVEVSNPFNEPRIHKNFPDSIGGLEKYRQEVVEGIHDHWIKPDGHSYSYHDRLRNYEGVDQIEYIINKLLESYYSRRCQAITWMPQIDPMTEDAPCMQRIWARLLPDEDGTLTLNMNTHWRSRDLIDAWFMNVYAITDLQRLIAEKLAEEFKKEIKIGRYVDISDSLHIYGRNFEKAAPEIPKMGGTSYKERAWESTDPVFVAMTEEMREKLKENPDFMLA